MADNVAITAGSGTSIAADDVSSVFYQKVKSNRVAEAEMRRIKGADNRVSPHSRG